MTRTSVTLALGMGLVLVAAGCGGGGGNNTPDMATPAPAKSWADVQGDMMTKGCLLMACHGKGTTASTLIIDTTAGMEMANYNLAKSKDINTASPDQSLLLAKPLNTVMHTGGMQFLSTADPIYQRWLGWIKNGAPF